MAKKKPGFINGVPTKAYYVVNEYVIVVTPSGRSIRAKVENRRWSENGKEIAYRCKPVDTRIEPIWVMQDHVKKSYQPATKGFVKQFPVFG